MGKDLSKLVKYYMCSDHFENHCFIDPQTKSRLKKTSRPVVVPVPTIFKYNLRSVISKDIPISPPKILSPSKSVSAPRPVISLNKEPEEEEELVEDAPNSFTYVVSGAGDEDEVVVCKYGMEEDEQEEEQPEESAEHELEWPCRLCNQGLTSSSVVSIIFEKKLIVDALEVILPGQIEEDDGFSPIVCQTCVAELHEASRIVANFRWTQEELRVST